MGTFGSIKAEVLTNIIDLPPAVQANVGTYVNRAINLAEKRYNFRYMEQNNPAPFITTVNSLALGTIANFKQLIGRGPYILQQYAPAKPLYKSTEAGQELRTFTLNTLYPDQPHYYRLVSIDQNNLATFQIYPYPDSNSDWSDGNYRIVIPYVAYSAALVNTGDSNWMTVNAELYVTERATAFGFQADWDTGNMALWMQEAEKEFQAVKLADKHQRMAGVDTLNISPEGANTGMVQR